VGISAFSLHVLKAEKKVQPDEPTTGKLTLTKQ